MAKIDTADIHCYLTAMEASVHDDQSLDDAEKDLRYRQIRSLRMIIEQMPIQIGKEEK